MYVWLFATVLIGCEQVVPKGDPLQPVSVGVSVSEESGTEAVEVEPEEEVFSISSEELAAIASGETEDEPAVDKPEASSPQGQAPVVDTVPSEPAAEPATTPSASVPSGSGWSEVIGKAWPVRLVTTVPNATPPRAILGLPDGREVVVNPGSMVPDMGLVVVAIAPNSAELARIAPAGDHATIETMTLRAQY